MKYLSSAGEICGSDVDVRNLGDLQSSHWRRSLRRTMWEKSRSRPTPSLRRADWLWPTKKSKHFRKRRQGFLSVNKSKVF
jgi:hypothetical protein